MGHYLPIIPNTSVNFKYQEFHSNTFTNKNHNDASQRAGNSFSFKRNEDTQENVTNIRNFKIFGIYLQLKHAMLDVRKLNLKLK